MYFFQLLSAPINFLHHVSVNFLMTRESVEIMYYSSGIMVNLLLIKIIYLFFNFFAKQLTNDNDLKNKFFKFIFDSTRPVSPTASSLPPPEPENRVISDQAINLFSNLFANIPINHKHKPSLKRKFEKNLEEKNTANMDKEEHLEPFSNLVKKKIDDVRKNTMDKI
jgi:hypothetical protein